MRKLDMTRTWRQERRSGSAIETMKRMRHFLRMLGYVYEALS